MHFSAFLTLLMFGGLLGAVVLIWIICRDRQNLYVRLVNLTTFLTFDLILFGCFTRLTDSGLGCPDWPGCYAQATPFHARDWINMAQAQLPTGPVTMIKAWIEMLHRYFAMTVGLLITVITVLAWRRRQQFSPWLASNLFILVCIQGAFGAWTVTMKLQPLIVTLHLLLAMALLVGLSWLGGQQQKKHLVSVDRKTQYWATCAILALLMQIALGGWVSTNYAVLACPDFPLCHGQWLPEMNFTEGFSIWRALGQTTQGAMITMPALIAIHWLHRVFAIVVSMILLGLVCSIWKYGVLRLWGAIVLITLLIQILTGISNIVLQWPLLIAVIHNGGAAFLLIVLVRIKQKLRNTPDNI